MLYTVKPNKTTGNYEVLSPKGTTVGKFSDRRKRINSLRYAQMLNRHHVEKGRRQH